MPFKKSCGWRAECHDQVKRAFSKKRAQIFDERPILRVGIAGRRKRRFEIVYRFLQLTSQLSAEIRLVVGGGREVTAVRFKEKHAAGRRGGDAQRGAGQ